MRVYSHAQEDGLISGFINFVEYVRSDARSKMVSSVPRGMLTDPVFRFTVLMRLNEYLANAPMPWVVRLVPRLLFRGISIKLGFSVPINTFGPGLAIVHYGLLIVSPYAKIGKNCRVHAGVNIGAAAGLGGSRAPIIGDNCYLGPGAKLFGDIAIGDGCAVGANAVVTKSFGNDVTIGGVPARIISHSGSTGFIRHGAE
jgi:serine O-acetyltransferase